MKAFSLIDAPVDSALPPRASWWSRSLSRSSDAGSHTPPVPGPEEMTRATSSGWSILGIGIVIPFADVGAHDHAGGRGVRWLATPWRFRSTSWAAARLLRAHVFAGIDVVRTQVMMNETSDARLDPRWVDRHRRVRVRRHRSRSPRSSAVIVPPHIISGDPDGGRRHAGGRVVSITAAFAVHASSVRSASRSRLRSGSPASSAILAYTATCRLAWLSETHVLVDEFVPLSQCRCSSWSAS